MSTATVDRSYVKLSSFFPFKLQNLQVLLDSDKKSEYDFRSIVKRIQIDARN